MANDATGPATEAPVTAARKDAAAGSGQYSPDPLKESKPRAAAGNDVNLDLVLDVPVSVSLRVGSTDLSIRELVKLVEGSVIALDRQADEPVDVLVNGTLIAHGEIVVVDDRFGVRLTDVVSPVERIRKIN
jgi:flagellar motor switch protein FliN